MLGGVSGIGSYMNHYSYYGSIRASRVSNAMQLQTVQRAEGAALAGRVSVSERASNPGVPVEPVSPVKEVNANGTNAVSRAIPFLRKGMDPAEFAVRMRIQYSEDVQKPQEEEECQTCERRKYKDGSDDLGVSYKMPTHIAPEQAASAVRGHEMEHVVREQSKAERNDQKVISQSVTVNSAICPECGESYISGGTTRTITMTNEGGDAES